MFGWQATSWSAQGYVGKLGVVIKHFSAVSNSEPEVEQDGRLHSGERPAAEHLPVHADHHAVVGRAGGMSQRSSAGVPSAVYPKSSVNGSLENWIATGDQCSKREGHT